jgi:hypothetical protein
MLYVNSPECGLKCNYKSLMYFCQMLEERSGNAERQCVNCLYVMPIMAKGETLFISIKQTANYSFV